MLIGSSMNDFLESVYVQYIYTIYTRNSSLPMNILCPTLEVKGRGHVGPTVMQGYPIVEMVVLLHRRSKFL